MQSLASLMSVKPVDIGNLDDFNESDEEEDKKSVTATGRQERAAPSGRSSVVSSSATLFHFPSSLLFFFLTSSVVPHTLTRPNRPAPPPPDKRTSAGPSLPASGTLVFCHPPVLHLSSVVCSLSGGVRLFISPVFHTVMPFVPHTS